MIKQLAASVLVLSVASPGVGQHNTLSDAERDEGWTLLFDGRDLANFTTAGDIDAWGVEDGSIVNADPGKGWWLRTLKMYRDFELRVDFQIPEGGNSGVGLRGSSVGDPAFTGMEVQIYDSHGDEPRINGCGALYNAIAPVAQAVKAPGEWNSYHIRLVGDTLDVWLNDTHIHQSQRLDDRGYHRAPDQPIPLNTRLPTGYIAFQDHGEGGLKLRNVKVLDLSPDKDPGGYEPIFNGRDLTGWTARDDAKWAVENGTLVGRDGPGHIFWEGEVTDFEMRTFVRVNTNGNSGVYLRVRPNPDSPWPIGYEAQVDNHDPKNFTGCIYNKAWPADLDGPITHDNAWFDYRIRAQGERIRTWINGVPFVDARLDEFNAGAIALQGHHVGNVIEYRDLQLRKVDRRGAKPRIVGQ